MSAQSDFIWNLLSFAVICCHIRLSWGHMQNFSSIGLDLAFTVICCYLLLFAVICCHLLSSKTELRSHAKFQLNWTWFGICCHLLSIAVICCHLLLFAVICCHLRLSWGHMQNLSSIGLDLAFAVICCPLIPKSCNLRHFTQDTGFHYYHTDVQHAIYDIIIVTENGKVCPNFLRTHKHTHRLTASFI